MVLYLDTHHIDDTKFGFILDIVHENFITYRDECYHTYRICIVSGEWKVLNLQSINQDNHIILGTWSMEMMN